ncbi:hypothetical protein N2W20_002055 [Clostridium perfringens]|uniref:hypothetical protein n=1 Tax=Clostridium perfringens TaxID=1502 RepID=UPI0010E8D5AA|nr:hypothetical protein [Clostridium perfringens]EJT5917557.1 hypothetical protein [Clostridium perfringens]EJT6136248.1 hypothetical protein [Clostridium perfringens]MDK0927206.1 hypothetical protein [Clostridium perfringens]UBK61606.1 hypothetical protein KLF23_04655 [Clostridium perfringens]VTR82376.1 Uncharacterised protein [Clostridium perfringens]
MLMTYRQFPHPVLNEFDSGYENAKFKSVVNTKLENGYININVNFILSCGYLESLIKVGLASYAVHLECKSTRFRMIEKSNESLINIDIDSKRVNKEIEVCCLIVANQNIDDFKSDDFIEDFNGVSFQIDRGEILAHDTDKIINIEKSGDSDKVPSIFAITFEEGKLKTPLNWQASGKKIIIKISKDNFTRYKQLAKIENFRPALANILIIPVLTDIISVIKEDSEDGVYSLSSEDECYKVIEDKLVALGYESPTKLKSETSVSVAYQLLGNLLDNSLIALEDFIMEEEE